MREGSELSMQILNALAIWSIESKQRITMFRLFWNCTAQKSHHINWLSDVNTLRPRQNGHRYADDIFKRIFLNENIRISIKISLKFVPKGPVDNNPALVQTMAWRRSGDKSLSEPLMVSLLTHICVTRTQWVKMMSDSFCLPSTKMILGQRVGQTFRFVQHLNEA